MDALQFYPERMREQAQRLRGAAVEMSATLEELSTLPGLLQGQLGDSALPHALTGLLRRGEDQARALQGLAAALEQSAEIYEGAEHTLAAQAGQLPGAPGGGRAAGQSESPRLFFPTGPVQFGALYVDTWLTRLVLEDERESLPPFPGTSG